ncbi:FAD-binding and (Fe-S)-binding domain-containing protein [Candidatus Marinarcus aquaticus]|uniref:D-lactate dehydrogenase (cytochrome) n=1 Tax=Candidatus Marinarcus aquaticus TaxID=2044504 RepID=A0A4Q0XR42_9BACT|nr:FAD-binding and (Fe-S)-binding domain-containing protein [Candidatus Marinarcus aquaticus]RXJ58024.1 4Fe-4S ferredoxin [Candidatus Marinarcus aquaticus]
MLEGKYQKFYEEIIQKIPKKYIFTDKLHTLAYGTDASFYRLIPKIVIKAQHAFHVQEILKLATYLKLSVTFRAAGTSLSGQAISDSILIVTSRDWKGFSISKDRSSITLEPSITGAAANKALAPFKKKIGPDPASIDAAMIGGIAANNASGMCCGVAQNSYKTVESMQIIFYDGTLLDTADIRSKELFRDKHQTFCVSLEQYANEVKANNALKKKITQKFKIKNTCGYSLNALVDFDDVFDILQHLIIGSEGTLGFIKEITYKTVDDHPNKASALVFFTNTHEACDAVAKLKLSTEVQVDAVELMDSKALKSVQDQEGMPEYLKEFDEHVTALLIETRAKTKSKLKEQTKAITELLSSFKTVRKVAFTDKENEYKLFWKIRKGLFPAVGAVRETGTTVIIEDVAFAIEDLAAGTLKLQELFKKHGYHEALIFGHALEGNLHFVFTQDFSTKEEVERYDAFMNDVTQLVAVEYKGSLKAEHGTGRNMAAFVELEWGEQAYKLMKDIKALFDPYNILNPGVIINDDKEAHLKNLKPLPATNPLVDKCIECGFCEPYCPSNVLTFTPRHRIVASREISRLHDEEQDILSATLLKEAYQYDGIETCATCSLCSTVCPVGIDTGSLTKHYRHEQITPKQERLASVISNNFSVTLNAVRFGLKSANMVHTLLGTSTMSSFTQRLREWSGNSIPLWSPTLPKANRVNKNSVKLRSSTKKVVYFSSCINRSMGQSKDDSEQNTLFDTTLELLTKAGYEVIFPEKLESLCCGMPFSSKGFHKQAKEKSDELEKALQIATNQGEYPVLCDTSPCTKKMIESFKSNIKLYEPIAFSLEHLVPHLSIEKVNEPIVIHTTCSSRKMGLHEQFIALANLLSDEVIVPEDVKCCGFAGDRGFNYPELNQSALRHLNDAIPNGVKLAFSTSKTCEIGLSNESGLNYNSIFYLLNQCSK